MIATLFALGGLLLSAALILVCGGVVLLTLGQSGALHMALTMLGFK